MSDLLSIHWWTYRKYIAAEEEVERLGDPAAAFHLARQYEAQEKIPDAIRYYSQVWGVECQVWGVKTRFGGHWAAASPPTVSLCYSL